MSRISDSHSNPEHVSDHESHVDSECNCDEREGSNVSSHAAPNALVKKAKASTSSKRDAKNESELNTLSLLPTMPLDILFEILAQLSPKDLLVVRRTNKLFRQTLSLPSARSMWKRSRGVDVPDCPEDLDEAQWTTLLYSSLCQHCSTTGVRNADFYLRLRLCKKCRRKGYLVRSKALTEFPGCENALLLIPSTTTSGWSHGPTKSSRFFLRADIQSMIHNLSIFEHQKDIGIPGAQAALDNFQRERLALVRTINKTAPTYEMWRTRQAVKYQAELDTAIRKRAAQIRQKFIELGYQEADVHNALQSERNYEVKNTVLTERTWNMIRPRLELLVNRKALGLQYEQRKGIVDQLYMSFQKTIPPRELTSLPPRTEIHCIESFSRHINASWTQNITEASFTQAMSDLPALLASKKEATLKDLARLARESLCFQRADQSISDFELLSLATTVFRCSCYSRKPYLFGAADVLAHYCYMSDPRKFSISADARAIAVILIKVAGLNPANATIEDMDNAGTRYTCSGGECTNYFAFDWRQAVMHLMKHLKGIYETAPISEALWSVLSKEDTEIVKRREADDKTWSEHRWLCSHCSEVGITGYERSVIEDHLRQRHSIDSPLIPNDLFFYGLRPGSLNPVNIADIQVAKETNDLKPPAHEAGRNEVVPQKKNSADTYPYSCKHCQESSSKKTRNRLFNLRGVQKHIQDIHKISTPAMDTDWIVNTTVSMDDGVVVRRDGSVMTSSIHFT